MLCVQSCQKETIPKVPFWEILDGEWRLDGSYSINGDNFEFTDFDKEFTTLVFKNRGNAVYKRGGLSFFGGYFFSIKNDFGLYHFRETNFSEVPSKIFGLSQASAQWYSQVIKSYDLTYGRKVGDKYIVYENRTNLDAKIKDEFLPPKSVYGVGASYQEVEEHIEDLESSCQLDMVDYFIFDNHFSESKYKIELSSSTQMTITVYYPYYEREVNGQKIDDEIIFTLSRINGSDIVTVPPFSLSDYEINDHLKFDNLDDLYIRGNAKIVSDGVDNGCLSLQSTADYVQLEYDVRPTVPMTLSLWVKPNQTSSPKQVIYSKYKNQYGPFIMSLEGDKFVLEVNDGSGNLQNVSSSKEINSGEWNHICLSVNEDNLATLYINGAADSQGTINSLTVDASAEVLLGTTQEAVENNLNVNFNGFLDEFIFFQKVLTGPEIAQLYFWHLNN